MAATETHKILGSLLAGIMVLALAPSLRAQAGVAQEENAAVSTTQWHGEFFTRDDVIHYTSYWNGPRFPDGRPKVPDDILDRMKTVTLEEAWATLRGAGFPHQYEDGWYVIHPNQVLVGRALTSVWMPGRADIQTEIQEQGKSEHRIGGTNAWPVDMLQPRDVYVSDHFGLKVDGPSIGDNVGNAIYARTGNGIVYNGAVRDINGLEALPNFTSFVRSYDPSHHFGMLGPRGSSMMLNSTMVSINGPTRIGQVLVMPGDVVLGRNGGVIFIPPQLAEKVVKDSERTHLEDTFGHLRLEQKKYTAGQIDGRWSPEIEQDFHQWLRANEGHLPAPQSVVDEILNEKK
jgi:regulator of RNase E activity RraA